MIKRGSHAQINRTAGVFCRDANIVLRRRIVKLCVDLPIDHIVSDRVNFMHKSHFYFSNPSGNKVPVNYFFRQENLKILFFYDSEQHMHKLIDAGIVDGSTHVFWMSAWYCDASRLTKLKNILHEITTHRDTSFINRFHYMANSFSEYVNATSLFGRGVPVHLINQNWIVNEEAFTIKTDQPKAYDLVVNSRGRKWKRHNLTKSVESKCFITYFGNPSDDMNEQDFRDLNPSDIFPNVAPQAVCEIINRGYVGGIFSAIEGACFSSTEYLLSGLPVVSTRSLGGRDEWYDDYNSMIVEPEPSNVVAAVQSLKRRIVNGDIAPEQIRARAIRKSAKYRNDLAQVLEGLAGEAGLSLDGKQLIRENFEKARGNTRPFSALNAQFVDCGLA